MKRMDSLFWLVEECKNKFENFKILNTKLNDDGIGEVNILINDKINSFKITKDNQEYKLLKL